MEYVLLLFHIKRGKCRGGANDLEGKCPGGKCPGGKCPNGKCPGKRGGGIFLFNDALNTFYLRLYGVGHMVKDHSDSERGNPLLPHGLLFPISSKGSFICTIPQTG